MSEKKLSDKYKQAESYRQYTEAQSTKLASQKEAIKLTAERQTQDLLRSKGYESVEIQDSKETLSSDLSGKVIVTSSGYKDEDNYTIKVPVDINQGQIKNVDLSQAKKAKTPKEATIKESIPFNHEQELVMVNLASFTLKDDGTEYYKVYHPSIDPINPIASISKDKYETAENKKPLLVSSARQEANREGFDLRFAGSFVLPKIQKTSQDEKDDQQVESGWKESTSDKEGNIVKAGMVVSSRFGDGRVENIYADPEGSKVHIKTEKGKRVVKASEVNLKDISKNTPSTSQVTSQQDTSLQYKEADGAKQYKEREQSKDDRQVQALLVQTENELVRHLRGQGFEAVKIKDGSTISVEARRSGYNGEAKVPVEASYNEEIKQLVVPVSIVDDQRRFPEKDNVIEAFNSGKSEVTKISEDLKQEVNTKMAKIEEWADWYKKETKAALEQSPKPSKEKIEKEASSTPPSIHYAPVLNISRHVLPDSIEEGDTINIEGARYRVESIGSTDSISREDKSGSLVTLRLIRPKDSDEPGKDTSYTS